ncbi:MAG: tRNA (adenosine(37)-N6)-threonylcarbamoyltransferase complex ATPase subunit type 1 TsaE [Anaerolineales bacterium]|nr:tRNA (adenosine(37)-N6)-threonylcarbamoyltransferase complex ATPase subunit type 1 TsaE [Anaerolineales bacterium]
MPVLNHQSLEFISRSTEQTRRAGMRLGALLQTGDVICLIGDLGAGKTTLVQGISAGWGSLDAVSSPTFVLVNVYRRPDGQNLYHLDAYRLSGPTEAADLDLDMLIEHGPLVVEWADRIQDALPEDHLRVKMNWINDQQRDLMITAHGPRYETILTQFRQKVYGVS